jgi:curved DNA-binding protein CbpA
MDDGIDLSAAERETLTQLAVIAESRDHYALLGVVPGAPASDIQRAFYERSRSWHPDRFFRKELGPFREKLDQVFLAVTESYRILSNPATRAAYDRTRPAAPARPAPRAPGAAAAASGPAAARLPRPPDRAMSKAVEEMRNQLKERLSRAAALHAEGMAALKDGHVVKASNALSMALTFDPNNAQYKADAESARREARIVQAKQFLAAAENAESFANHRQAQASYQKAIEYGLREARVYYRLGLLTKKLDEDSKAAMQHLRQAVALDGENVEFRIVLAELYVETGMQTSARAQYEHILSLDKSNSKAKDGLKALNAL